MHIISTKEDHITLHSIPTWTSFATSTNGQVYTKSALMKGCKIGAFTTDNSIIFLNGETMVTPLAVTAGDLFGCGAQLHNQRAEHDS